MITKHVIISGHVQGVFFRVHAQEEALKNNVLGWVRNRLDGSVEAVFQGAEQNVITMIEWSYKGSPSSTVSSVKTEDVNSKEMFSTFSILPTL